MHCQFYPLPTLRMKSGRILHLVRRDNQIRVLHLSATPVNLPLLFFKQSNRITFQHRTPPVSSDTAAPPYLLHLSLPILLGENRLTISHYLSCCYHLISQFYLTYQFPEQNKSSRPLLMWEGWIFLSIFIIVDATVDGLFVFCTTSHHAVEWLIVVGYCRLEELLHLYFTVFDARWSSTCSSPVRYASDSVVNLVETSPNFIPL